MWLEYGGFVNARALQERTSCNESGATLEHIIDRYLGGTNDWNNLAMIPMWLNRVLNNQVAATPNANPNEGPKQLSDLINGLGADDPYACVGATILAKWVSAKRTCVVSTE